MIAAELDGPASDDAQRFQTIFSGLARVHGQYVVPAGAKPIDKGKLHNTTWARTVHEPVTLDLWQGPPETGGIRSRHRAHPRRRDVQLRRHRRRRLPPGPRGARRRHRAATAPPDSLPLQIGRSALLRLHLGAGARSADAGQTERMGGGARLSRHRDIACKTSPSCNSIIFARRSLVVVFPTLGMDSVSYFAAGAVAAAIGGSNISFAPNSTARSSSALYVPSTSPGVIHASGSLCAGSRDFRCRSLLRPYSKRGSLSVRSSTLAICSHWSATPISKD